MLWVCCTEANLGGPGISKLVLEALDPLLRQMHHAPLVVRLIRLQPNRGHVIWDLLQRQASRAAIAIA